MSAKLAIPLAWIIFGTVTKWWFTLPTDAVDTMMWGFPFPFMCEGWHTSMSLQFFLLEGMADFAAYFAISWLIVFILARVTKSLNQRKIIRRFLWVTALIMLLCESILIYSSNSLYYFSRPFEMRILDTGSVFIWENTQRPDITQYK